MRPNYCLNIFQVSIFAVLFLILDADGDDPNCKVKIKVADSTVYKPVSGQDFKIHCIVAFCSNSVNKNVTWYKYVGTKCVTVNVSSGSHISTDWTFVNQERISYLIFKKIRRNDYGVYQCQGGGSVSCNISVLVKAAPEPQPFWIYVSQVVGFVTLVIIMLTLYVASRWRCKGRSRETPDLSRQNSHDADTTHVHENNRRMSVP
ncbi:uncharacterized protein LOC144461877 [Epinephelus lanceolatus]